MHPATEELLGTILIVLRDQGEDAAFDYVRREVLGRNRISIQNYVNLRTLLHSISLFY